MLFPQNQSGKNEYNYPDKQLLPVNYYRLKMTDKDGSVQYSKTIAFRQSSFATAQLQVMPNPVTGNFRLHFDGVAKASYRMDIRTVGGVSILSRSVNVSEIQSGIQLARPASMTAGMYWITLVNDQNKVVAKTNLIAR